MLALSPSLPLVIDYLHGVAADLILAVEKRDRVRCVRLHMPDLKLRELIMAMDEEYPVLEYLMMGSTTDELTALMLPETFQAPCLRGLVLKGFDIPIGSPLLTTAIRLETLALTMVHPSSYFQPNILLHWLSFMPQLEKLLILFLSPVPNSDVETHTPIMTNVTLPNLRCFEFQGAGAYVEAVVHRLTTPRLEKFRTMFVQHPMFSMPSLLPFMRTSNLGFDSVKFKFSSHHIYVRVYLHEKAEVYGFSITVHRWYLNRESSVDQIFRSLSQIFSTIEHLTFELEPYTQRDQADRTEWRRLLRAFRNVKTLCVNHGLVKELSRSLQLDDGELPPELLPKLQELTYFGSGDTGDAFTSFLDARQNAGRPVTLVRP
jgi:hypothetical protein